MREWFKRWLKLDEPKVDEKTCEKSGHDYGRVKQWILPGGVVVHKRKCRRCQALELED